MVKQQLDLDEHLCSVTQKVLGNLLDGHTYRVKSQGPPVGGLLGALLGKSMPSQKEVDAKVREMMFAVCAGCDSLWLKAEVEKDYGEVLHSTLHGIDAFCEVNHDPDN